MVRYMPEDLMKDPYGEYERAGVMPGNLENDRLLSNDEMIEIVCYPIEQEFELCKAQDVKTSKWWIERIEKYDSLIFDNTRVILITYNNWQALKKQIGGE